MSRNELDMTDEADVLNHMKAKDDELNGMKGELDEFGKLRVVDERVRYAG